MGRTIKTRHIQKDIKVLDKTVTAAEHMKGAYIRTRDSAEQTQVKEQGNPVGYAEDQVMEKGERAARGTIQQAEKQGKKVIHAVREKGRTEKEAEAFREKNGDPSASSFSSGTEKTYQPKEQMKNRTGAQTGRTAGRQAAGGREAVKKGEQIRELPKQTVKTIDRGEKTIKTAHASIKTSGKAAVKGTGRTIKTAQRTGYTAVRTTEVTARACRLGSKSSGSDYPEDRSGCEAGSDYRSAGRKSGRESCGCCSKSSHCVNEGSCFCYSCRRLDRGADPADRHPVWRIVQYGRRK